MAVGFSLINRQIKIFWGGWGAELIYHGGGGHGKGEDHVQGYVIEVETGDEPVEEEPEIDFMEVMASADAAKGEGVFNKCKACHKLEDGANGTGPYLLGIVGREVGAADGYGYSGNLVAVADVWTPENLNGFLANPKAYAPGTKMAYKGMPKIEDRANLIAWLEGQGG